MTEENKKQEIDESVAAGPAVRPASKLPGIMASFALLLAIGTGGAAAYLWGQLQTVRSDAHVQFSDHASIMAEYGNRINQLTKQEGNSRTEAAEMLKNAEALDVRVTGLAHEIASITGLNRVDWQVSHAEHLIRAAHQRLVLTSDVDGAFALLDAADKVVGDIKEIGTIKVRRAFATDLNTLNVASRIDIAGIFVKLDALQEQIQELSMPSIEWKSKAAKMDVSEEGAGTKEKLATVFNNMLSVVAAQYEVQKLDEPVKPILSTDQRIYLKQNLSLLLEQAQLAVIKRDPVVYRRVLKQAEDWVRGHFNLDTPVAQATLQTFSRLSAVELNPTAPDISASMRALKVFSEAWNKEKEIRQQSEAKELGEPTAEPADAADEESVLEKEPEA